MKHQFRLGAYPTMITPFKSSEVDYETAKKYVQWYQDNDCDGIFAVCQSSEIQYLSLNERVQLNKTVYDEAKRIAKESNVEPMTIVSSGHVSTSLTEQAYELNRMAESGTDALILITNRLDPDNLGDDEWIRNCERLLAQLPEEIPLGLYECPVPYNRLVTPRILDWCLQTGRFYFMKDTCCNMETLRQRLDILKGTQFKLLNANCQTLLPSLQAGASGYCGVLGNFHPKLFAWLCHNYDKEPEKAAKLASFMCTIAFTEGGLPYPLSAKYHMCLEGIPTELTSRVRQASALTPYAKDCVQQLKNMCDILIASLEG